MGYNVKNGNNETTSGLSPNFTAGTDTGVFSGVIGETITFTDIENVVAPIPACFAAGTLIETKLGPVRIEDLKVGDEVLTKDNSHAPLRWICSTVMPAMGDLAPILIKAGALGNSRDLRVSQQHRMLLSGWQADLLFGEPEVIVPAKALLNDQTILRVEGGMVEYFHMLFDTHEIVWAEGCPSESFHPGDMGWTAANNPARDEILRLFPELAGSFDKYGPSVRPSLKLNEGQVLAQMLGIYSKKALSKTHQTF